VSAPLSPARSSRDATGTAAVEFALVLPLLLVVGLGLVQVGLLVRDRLLVEEAARSAAREASIVGDAGAITTAAREAAPALNASAMQIRVERSGSRGDPVTVEVTYADEVRVPFVSWLVGRRVVAMHATTTDRQEFG
jgi:Flp pilus assembly protein TadG